MTNNYIGYGYEPRMWARFVEWLRRKMRFEKCHITAL
jgi:hypothetical protein